jgi:tetratricopeptide (TPR) repeat protein
MFPEAIDALERLIERDVEFPGAGAALKCAGFWRERLESDGPSLEGFERGEQLLGQWRLFQAFASRLDDMPERCMFAIKQFVFTSALASYTAAEGGFAAAEGGFEIGAGSVRAAEAAGAAADGGAGADNGETSPEGGPRRKVPETGGDPYLLLQVGRCFKGAGNYERAIEWLERANRESRDDARIMAELADCYSLVNESRAAKVFFREAFSVDAQAVDLAGLESPLVQRLAARLRSKGWREPLLNEWMPVYGAIWGVFNVKREMKPLEFGKLKQAIYHLEKECGAPGPEREMAVPRLINRYFWLIDHYMTTGEPRERIDETLEKLRGVDPAVHEEYTT